MKRRSFLKGLLAAVAAPLVVMKKMVSGEPMPRPHDDQTFTFVFGRQEPVVEIPMDHIPIGVGPHEA